MINSLLAARSLQELFHRLLEIPSFGRFLAFQYSIDLNYSPYFDFDEMEFVVAGPGALQGIAKCFVNTGDLKPEDVIRAMTYAAPEFSSSGATLFEDLWGRPLHLIDCQHLFCEVDKYARVAHPHLNVGGRSRIKQNYRMNRAPISLGYPPKWGLPLKADDPTVFSVAEQLVGSDSDG